MESKNIDRLISLIFSTRRLMVESGATPSPCSLLHAETLRFITEKRNPTMKEVALFLSITPPSATSLIDSLVKSKHIVRIQDSVDRRTVRLKITPEGKRAFTRACAQRKKNMKKIMSALNDYDRTSLITILEKLRKTYL